MKKEYCIPTCQQTKLHYDKFIASSKGIELQTIDKSKMFFECDDSLSQQSDVSLNDSTSNVWEIEE